MKRLKELVIDAKENGIGVVPAVVKRMLEKTMFLFGFVDILGCSVTQRVEEIAKLQNKRARIAFDRYLTNVSFCLMLCISSLVYIMKCI